MAEPLTNAALHPCGDDLFLLWRACPAIKSHLGGYCRECRRNYGLLFCPKCHKKTVPRRLFCSACWTHTRTFRLLVEWMRRWPMRRHWIEDLPIDLQQLYHDGTQEPL